MTGFFHDAAQASLWVAVALLLLAAAACGVQLARVRDARTQRFARLYLDPLSAWCLAAIAAHATAVVATGDVTVFSLLVPICMGVAAVLLRWADDTDDTNEPAVVATHEPPLPQPDPAPAPVPVRPSSGSLWSRAT